MSEQTDEARHARPRRGLGLSGKIFLGLLLGVAAGLSFGEYCGHLRIVGEVFIGLLQMTVLPYIAVSLVASIGRLDIKEGWRLAGRGIAILLVIWTLTLLIVAFLPLSFPAFEAGAFFSRSLVEPPEQVDFLGLYVPVNVFNSLASDAVPAVVLFCIALGVALMGIPGKESLLQSLQVLADGLTRLNAAVVRLTPIGIFAIAASAIGTMTLGEMGRLQVYVLSFLAASVILAFGILPLLIAAATPFGYREVLRASRDPLVLAFATGKVLVTLPMLIENVKKLFAERNLLSDEASRDVEVLVPLSYPFPHAGRLLGLLFIPFAAWFVGNAMEPADYPAFLPVGLVSWFGGALVATPFLLDLMHVPADMLELFVASGVLTARLGDMVGAMHFVALTVLTSCAALGLLKIRWRPLLLRMGAAAGILVCAMLGMRAYFAGSMEGTADMARVLEDMRLQTDPVPERIEKEAGPNPVPLGAGQTLLERVRARGVLRVGFHRDQVPFSFFNQKGYLGGFDIDMAHQLATDLGVRIEFVPFRFSTLAEQFDADHFEIAMAGVIGTLGLAEHALVSRPYLDSYTAVVVPRERAAELSTLAAIRKLTNPRVGLVDITQLPRKPQRHVPGLEIVKLESYEQFFEGTGPRVDAVLIGAEAGAAWTLLYPKFKVVRLRSGEYSIPMVYPVAGHDRSMKDFIDHWVTVKKADRTIAKLYDYWILGRGAVQPAARWSVIRDLLDWVD
jgi:Na+/H+-dicarboxylate symporter